MKARENPFSTERVLLSRWQMPGGETWDAILGRLAAFGFRAAVVGPKGSGKTTFLEALAERLAADGYRPWPIRLGGEPGGPAPWRPIPKAKDFGPREVVLLDDADALGPLARRRLRRRVRRGAGLVAATHRDDGRLPVLLRCETSPALLARLVSEIAPGEAPRLAPCIDALFCRHRGNLRGALRELYDLYACPKRSDAAGRSALTPETQGPATLDPQLSSLRPGFDVI